MNHRMIPPLSLAVLLATVVVAGCDNANSQAQSSESRAPLPVVDVWTAQSGAVEVSQNLPGRLEASRTAVIVPRISGIVEKRLFTEGSKVQAGQSLYKLDDGTYQATLLNARASLQSAQAALQQATANRNLQRATVNRYAPLVKANAISKQDYDTAVANMKVQEANMAVAKAGIASAQATMDAANISFGYTNITAPISGVIGQSVVTEGAFVNAASTQMATIQQLDPMYINITQSASTLLQLKKALQSGAVQGGQNQIQVLMDNDQPYSYAARLLFIDQAVNQETGQVTLRAEVPNPNGDLLPGLYVRVVVPQSTYPHAYLVPQQAVTRNQKDSVMVVEKDGSYRPQLVTIVGQKGNDWIVTDGLTDGMQVIVAGLEKAGMMGAKQVQTRPWSAGGDVAQAQSQQEKSKATTSAQAPTGARDLTHETKAQDAHAQ